MPVDVVEAAVTVCGSAFYYMSRLRSVLIGAGVPTPLYERHAVQGAVKYVVARNVFADLAAGAGGGQDLLRRVVTDLANMGEPDADATDKRKARQAITDLREKATRSGVLVDPESLEARRRREAAQRQTDALGTRRAHLDVLGRRLAELSAPTTDAQGRGYKLERLLADVFAAFELAYRPSYKVAGEQIDGAFEYKGFTYLVEARWRAHPPDLQALAHFKFKVDGKLESTRGVFLSMVGFDQGIVDHLASNARGSGHNLVMFDGQDLSLILEDRPGLPDALDHKIAKASTEGVWFAPLHQI